MVTSFDALACPRCGHVPDALAQATRGWCPRCQEATREPLEVKAARPPAPGDRQPVEVFDGAGWRPGLLRMWWQDGDGDWWAQVAFTAAGDTAAGIGDFPAARVRPADEVDPRG